MPPEGKVNVRWRKRNFQGCFNFVASCRVTRPPIINEQKCEEGNKRKGS
ncbi:hypothetical protein, unlikely [Trypanosoma brucei brucei TREU927]|uniref:Uncharacterized protein n=1 Tax=Trypanosoma brucei brucei (strain 927/4 GUTat10.1) TaxID=185431 RepID=Q38F49_TRYB2|nr:hypothetical protein, unlikely [Trypanosoma brucei brucei TREU927]EAN76571.1 hypothetical protein, unlikely [Trypanosoma brucei brucei TREU927]